MDEIVEMADDKPILVIKEFNDSFERLKRLCDKYWIFLKEDRNGYSYIDLDKVEESALVSFAEELLSIDPNIQVEYYR